MPTWSGSERIRAREWRQAGMDKQVRPRRRRRSSAQLAAGGLPGLAPPGCSNKTPGLCFWAAPSGLGMSAGGRGTWRHKADATCMQMQAGLQRHAGRRSRDQRRPAAFGWMSSPAGRPAIIPLLSAWSFLRLLPRPASPTPTQVMASQSAAGCRLLQVASAALHLHRCPRHEWALGETDMDSERERDGGAGAWRGGPLARSRDGKTRRSSTTNRDEASFFGALLPCM
jgi:hypothetical protein